MASSSRPRGQPKLPPRQPYPRESGSDLAAQSLFPKLNPPLTITEIDEAIMTAFQTTKKNKAGDKRHSIDTAEKLVEVCLKHLRERGDPVIGPLLYSTASAEDLFTMDAIPHEVHRMRMDVGWFYQYLIIEFICPVERYHNEMRAVIKTHGGLGNDESALKCVDGYRYYHNSIRPHTELPDNKTPAEAAGIDLKLDKQNPMKDLVIKSVVAAASKKETNFEAFVINQLGKRFEKLTVTNENDCIKFKQKMWMERHRNGERLTTSSESTGSAGYPMAMIAAG